MPSNLRSIFSSILVDFCGFLQVSIFDPILEPTWLHFGSQNPSKSMKNLIQNRSKNGVENGGPLGIDFASILVDFGGQVGSKNRSKIDPKRYRKNDGKKKASWRPLGAPPGGMRRAPGGRKRGGSKDFEMKFAVLSRSVRHADARRWPADSKRFAHSVGPGFFHRVVRARSKLTASN